MLKTIKHSHGFSLVELAIVLVIVGVLISSFIGTLGSRIENTRRSDTLDQLNVIKDAIIGFASSKGRIPCPALTNSAGQEAPAAPVSGDSCDVQHGFVPGRTLGLQGGYNRDSLLLDSWGNPIRYSVTTADGDAFTEPQGIVGSGDGMREVGIANLSPNLTICNRDSTDNNNCLPAGVFEISGNVPFILLSLGKDGSDWVANVPAGESDQKENSGEIAVAANVAGEDIAYLVGDNRVFVSKTFSGVGATAGYYDDIIVWESPYVLYTKMIEAGRLP